MITPNTAPVSAHVSAPEADDISALEALLDTLRQDHPDTPHWEFCEGFLVALVCCRRTIAIDEYFAVLLKQDVITTEIRQPFEHLLVRRWQSIAQALDTRITHLDDPGAYHPALGDSGALAQQWARGFLTAVQAWPLEWAGPRNKEAQKWRTASLDVLQALTQDDTDAPALHAFTDAEGPPSVSHARMAAFADALWAVYNMREMWRTLGPRVETRKAVTTPGRNDNCPCGSGKKYKKCCANA
jgi:uncharacterized protein